MFNNDWQIETAFRAQAETAGRDRKISEPVEGAILVLRVRILDTTVRHLIYVY